MFSIVLQGREKTAVLVPVKPFSSAKTRLAEACSPGDRELLAKSMLQNVIDAAHGMRVVLVAPKDADDVSRFALVKGVRFLPEPEDSTGLDAAVQYGMDTLCESGYSRILVVHSDLPLVRDLRWLNDTDGIIVVPDRTGRGTNALSLPSDCGFQFRYGWDSCERHCEEARRIGIEPKVVFDPEGISVDVDEPSDLTASDDIIRRRAEA